MLNQTRPDSIRSPLLDRGADQGIRHGFFTREGGVSDGIYQSLNAGAGSRDDPANVDENRRRLAAHMNVAPENLVTVYQIHSPEVVHVTAPFGKEGRPEADAMVTDKPGLALGVLTADCGPVLFADPQARIIGAAHAGWKGAFSGVLEATVEAMVALGAARQNITAVLGPAIGQKNYEVGPEFVECFVSASSVNERYFRPSGRDGHALFNLNAYSLERLAACGVEAGHVDRCTYEDEQHFYSYRRATHRNEPDYGRQISAIVLEDL